MTYRLLASSLAVIAASSTLAEPHPADAYYDPAAMAEARQALKDSHGNQTSTLILGERLEYLSNGDDPLTVWEGQGWIGGDINKLWFKTEGEYANDEGGFEEVEIQALYSRAIAPFWDVQAGIRYDVDPSPSRAHAVVGVQGLTPYWFELDSQIFMSEEGNTAARLEAEYEFRLTQRWMLQPRMELNAAFANDEETGQGSGLSTLQAGLRLRYEVTREFAPYFGVSWQRSFGNTRDFARAEGEDSEQLSWVAGVRFWF